MRTEEPYDSSLNHWWGAPWPAEDRRAPICDDDRYRVAVPIGATCLLCEELVDENDRGITMGRGTQIAHAECNLRAVTGNLAHLEGKCHHIGECNELLAHQTQRQQARDVWQALVVEERFQ